eukprot:scaffold50799_cov23-Tisochrysis_lutea.AAC.2
MDAHPVAHGRFLGPACCIYGMLHARQACSCCEHVATHLLHGLDVDAIALDHSAAFDDLEASGVGGAAKHLLGRLQRLRSQAKVGERRLETTVQPWVLVVQPNTFPATSCACATQQQVGKRRFNMTVQAWVLLVRLKVPLLASSACTCNHRQVKKNGSEQCQSLRGAQLCHKNHTQERMMQGFKAVRGHECFPRVPGLQALHHTKDQGRKAAYGWLMYVAKSRGKECITELSYTTSASESASQSSTQCYRERTTELKSECYREWITELHRGRGCSNVATASQNAAPQEHSITSWKKKEAFICGRIEEWYKGVKPFLANESDAEGRDSE